MVDIRRFEELQTHGMDLVRCHRTAGEAKPQRRNQYEEREGKIPLKVPRVEEQGGNREEGERRARTNSRVMKKAKQDEREQGKGKIADCEEVKLDMRG